MEQFTVKQMRLLKGVTQASMAKLLNISVITYRKLEQHPQKITFEQASAICKKFECSFDSIFFGI